MWKVALSLSIAATAPLAAQPSSPQRHAGPLGANFNEHYEDVDFGELAAARAAWLRGFVAMPQVDPANAAAHIAVAGTLRAHQHGLKTILTLKWPFPTAPFPLEGSPAFARELTKVDAVLAVVLGKADIVEIGNEPFIETAKQYQDARLNAFYEAMAKHVIAYRKRHCGAGCTTRLYMGALNRLDLPARRTAATERWLAFVKATPELDGVDIHPHVPSLAASKPFLDYVLPRLRPDQHFIATEFSLIHLWKQHLADPVPAAYATRYRVAAGTPMWQEIRSAIASPFPQARWNDLLTGSAWYAGNRDYLVDQMRLFNVTGRLAVATYGFKQGSSMTRAFGPDSVPWLLNSVVANRTTRPERTSALPTNPYWLAAFRALAQP